MAMENHLLMAAQQQQVIGFCRHGFGILSYISGFFFTGIVHAA
jgi:hypothetical protein